MLLERGRVGETWARQYQGLRLHVLAGAATLPGMSWPSATERFPSASAMTSYLRGYAERFALDVREGVTVERTARVGDGHETAAAAVGGRAPAVRDNAPGWRLDTDRGPWRTERLVMATGIWSAPVEPPFPGRETFVGRALHVSAYRGPDELAGARVLVVGLGNSGKDVALAAAEVGASATVAVRDGALLVPYPNVLTQHTGELLRRVPPRLADALLRRLRREPVEYGLRWPSGPPTQAYPLVGLELLAALRAGRVGLKPAMTAYTATGARFADGSEASFDVIVLCTGYRPALDTVAAHVAFDEAGGVRTDASGVRAIGVPGLYLVGYRYPTLESWLQRWRRETPQMAQHIARDAAAAEPLRPATGVLQADAAPARPRRRRTLRLEIR